MISWENFNENLQVYGDELVIEVIDMFFEDHQETLSIIQQSIQKKDFPVLRFNAHHLKNTLSYFMDPVTTQLCRDLEEMGKNCTEAGMDEAFADLQLAIKLLSDELSVYRKKLRSPS